MNEQEKFDDLLRSKLSERDFPFDETNWDKAEGMIEKSEKKKKYGFISLVFLAGIIVGAAIMYPFIYSANTSNQATNTSAQQNNNAVVQSQINTVPATTSKTKAENLQPSPVPNHSVSDSGTHLIVETVTTQSTGNTKKNKHQKQTTADSSATAYSYVRPETEKSKRQKSHATQLANNRTSSSTYTTTPGTSTVTDNNKPVTNQNTTTANENNTSNNTTQVADAGKTAEQNLNTSAQATTNTNAAQDTANKNQVVTTTANTAKKTDSSTSNNSAGSNQPPAPVVKYTHTLFSIDAGAGYSLGWMKAGATQGSGISPIIGLSVTHYFNTNISALIGLQYNSLTHVNTLYSGTTAQYDFGSVTNVTSVTLKTLYYVAMPIKFQYNIDSKNIVALGVNVLYLLNSNSNVVSYNQNYFGTSGYTSSDKMGYTDGINSLDAQITLAYRRKIQRFTISAEGYYGLLDIENNSFFNNNVFERNSGLRLILSYDIIK